MFWAGSADIDTILKKPGDAEWMAQSVEFCGSVHLGKVFSKTCHVNIHVCIYIYMYVCMHVTCMYVHISVCIHLAVPKDDQIILLKRAIKRASQIWAAALHGCISIILA